LYTLNNGRGITAKITNYGALLTELHLPDRNGESADVALGFDTLDGYLAGHPYFGCTVGRVANRIANGKFTLDGKEYTLATNIGPNHLHGGEKGFDKKVWNVIAEHAVPEGVSLSMKYVSPDGEEGYPGNLSATVTYSLTASQLRVDIWADTDAPTIVNLANHSYWNLAGHDAGDILKHELVLNADNYTPTDETVIPTGEIASVKNTPFDFRESKQIGRDIGQLPGDGGEDPGGYDINFVLNGEAGKMKLVARVSEPSTGRKMEVFTDVPGVQLYTGNYLDGSLSGKGSTIYNKHAGFCLETQHFPDAINKEGTPGWQSVILRPGEVYSHSILFKFSTE
jgi:aldose 1-epimerase